MEVNKAGVNQGNRCGGSTQQEYEWGDGTQVK